MTREGNGFAFPQEKFTFLQEKKLKAGIFDGPQIRELMKDPLFDKVLSKAEMFVWQSRKLHSSW